MDNGELVARRCGEANVIYRLCLSLASCQGLWMKKAQTQLLQQSVMGVGGGGVKHGANVIVYVISVSGWQVTRKSIA